VRLDKARSLRAHGIILSDLVREAIDREYEEVMKSSKHRSVRAITQEIYEQYPDRDHVVPRKYDVHDRSDGSRIPLAISF
jgi:hypothetical protein